MVTSVYHAQRKPTLEFVLISIQRSFSLLGSSAQRRRQNMEKQKIKTPLVKVRNKSENGFNLGKVSQSAYKESC